MTRLKSEYLIPFVGLKLGKHEYSFKISDKFFESFEYSLIQSGDIEVNLTLEKKEVMLVGHYSITGSVQSACDRCNDGVDTSVDANYRIVYKFGKEMSNDESLIVILPEEHEIDVSGTLLELISVSIPNKVVHEEGLCNEEMIELYNEYTINSEEDIEDDIQNEEPMDPRWSALKDLKNKKK